MKGQKIVNILVVLLFIIFAASIFAGYYFYTKDYKITKEETSFQMESVTKKLKLFDERLTKISVSLDDLKTLASAIEEFKQELTSLKDKAGLNDSTIQGLSSKLDGFSNQVKGLEANYNKMVEDVKGLVQASIESFKNEAQAQVNLGEVSVKK